MAQNQNEWLAMSVAAVCSLTRTVCRLSSGSRPGGGWRAESSEQTARTRLPVKSDSDRCLHSRKQRHWMKPWERKWVHVYVYMFAYGVYNDQDLKARRWICSVVVQDPNDAPERLPSVSFLRPTLSTSQTPTKVNTKLVADVAALNQIACLSSRTPAICRMVAL